MTVDSVENSPMHAILQGFISADREMYVKKKKKKVSDYSLQHIENQQIKENIKGNT
jgi:hypothetical protein